MYRFFFIVYKNINDILSLCVNNETKCLTNNRHQTETVNRSHIKLQQKAKETDKLINMNPNKSNWYTSRIHATQSSTKETYKTTSQAVPWENVIAKEVKQEY